MRYISLSKKVFLLFFSLTVMAFLVAVVVYNGFEHLSSQDEKVKLLNEFQFQVKELELLHPIYGLKLAPPDLKNFGQKFNKTKELIEDINRIDRDPGSYLSKRLNTLSSNLKYYQIAYLELTEKYEKDLKFTRSDPIFSPAIWQRIAHLPAAIRANIHESVIRLMLLNKRVYHERAVGAVAEMRKIAANNPQFANHTEISQAIDRFVLKAEANYINYLGMKNGEAFLLETGKHVFKVTKKIISDLSDTIQASRTQLTWGVNFLLLISVILTVVWWYLATNYIRRFLHNQKLALTALERDDYDYEPPQVSNDETWELTLFMKKLALHLKRQSAEKETLSNLLRLSLESSPMQDYLHIALNLLLDSVSWLNIQPKGAIFLNEDRGAGEVLVLTAFRDLASELEVLCARVPFGKCLCGRAAAARKIQFAGSCDGEDHEIQFPGMAPHGHYNVPILHGDLVLGLIVFYLASDSTRNKHDMQFLQRVADVLSLGITRRWTEEAIEHRAGHDSLTELPNRHLLLTHLERALARARRHHHYGGVLFIDLDHFKTINDSLGHPVGDALLQEVAKRLKKTLRQEDTVARLGGDEFIILFTEVSDDKESSTGQVQAMAEKISDALSLPYKIQGHDLQITLSIGITMFPIEQESPNDILKNADTAMYRAKESGRNSMRFFLPSMQLAVEERLQMQNDLHNALVRDELLLRFQPQVDISGRLIGAEALVCWQHPVSGMISPDNFIPLAEETGQILAIGEQVMRTACEQLKAWSDQSLASSLRYLAVNVSSVQFRQADFALWVERILAETGADPSHLTLELTEGVLLENLEDTTRKMESLKRLGIRFSLDDFGTGYSSLAYLKRLPLDEIKIDHSFVRDITTDPNDANLVETIITMAANLDLEVVAEGVETTEQLHFLQQKGCCCFQGYLFSRPLPADEFSLLLEEQDSWGLKVV